MTKHCVKWNPVTRKNIVGHEFDSEIPGVLDTRYRGTLLSKILMMPLKNAIPFAHAVQMVSAKMTEAFDAKQLGYNPGQYNWFLSNFVEWISSLGYHIELTGDEFEPYTVSDKVL